MVVRNKIKKILLIGDVGGNNAFHVGDEAMLEANLALLRRLLPGAEVILVSRTPASTSQLYGAEASATLGFSNVSADREEELQRIDALVERALGNGDEIPDVFQNLLTANLLIISGGGNLSSTWPEHILERLALVRLARRCGIPIVIVGQTIGPNLEHADRLLVMEILDAARWVGLREVPSVALAIELGIPLEKIDYQLDDALFLAGRPCHHLWPRNSDGVEHRLVIAITLHQFVAASSHAPVLDQLAGELDRLVEQSGAHLLFIPHLKLVGEDGNHGDRAMGEGLAARMRHAKSITVLDVQGARETVWLTQKASMILSSRYHPIVFGLAAQRPCLALHVDAYTHIKLQGALIHAGMGEEYLHPLGEACIAGIAERAMSILLRREECGEQLKRNLDAWQRAEHDREKRLSRLLKGLSPKRDRVAHDCMLGLARTLAQRSGDDPGGWKKRGLVRELTHWRATAEAAVEYARSLEAARSELAEHAGNRAEEQ